MNNYDTERDFYTNYLCSFYTHDQLDKYCTATLQIMYKSIRGPFINEPNPFSNVYTCPATGQQHKGNTNHNG